MTTFHLDNLPKEKRNQMIGEFYDMIDSLEDRKEVRLFFRSLLAGDEIASLMRRIEIAVLLESNHSYVEIKRMLGVGNSKITSVHKNLLQDDSGYKFIAKRLIENRKDRLRKINKEAWNRNSPLKNAKRNLRHALLANLVDVAIYKIQEDKKQLEKDAVLFTPSASREK